MPGEVAMSSDSREYLEIIAKRAGAVVPCDRCGNHDVDDWDEAANGQAYAMAANAWKAGEFGQSSHEEAFRIYRLRVWTR